MTLAPPSPRVRGEGAASGAVRANDVRSRSRDASAPEACRPKLRILLRLKENEGRRSAGRRDCLVGPRHAADDTIPLRFGRSRASSGTRSPLGAPPRHSPRLLPLGSTSGRVSWNRRVQTGGPSPAPVQRAPRGPVLVPDERGPEAARVRSVSVRARAPRLLLAIRSTLMMASLRRAGGALVSKYGSRRQALSRGGNASRA
jgi:hypothetical protein